MRVQAVEASSADLLQKLFSGLEIANNPLALYKKKLKMDIRSKTFNSLNLVMDKCLM